MNELTTIDGLQLGILMLILITLFTLILIVFGRQDYRDLQRDHKDLQKEYRDIDRKLTEVKDQLEHLEQQTTDYFYRLYKKE
ncbi:hypothetical protein FOV01_13305 (plasmid) [Enterococcus faecalis]|uniref:hypothetical protein n=1 Tax=Enterococcus faecalis TaxID=1351 RepID=UPI0011857AE9|nr:hypothetical protein [Enterococcus faecalis]QDR53658.1 hypothetical protein FOV01_13305 [Enterococcus faecalis]